MARIFADPFYGLNLRILIINAIEAGNKTNRQITQYVANAANNQPDKRLKTRVQLHTRSLNEAGLIQAIKKASPENNTFYYEYSITT